MPLFFLLSGFFTMLVFSRRGIRAVLEQRALRLLVPLAIAMVTILPLTSLVMGWAVHRSTSWTTAHSPLMGRILAGDAAGVRKLLAEPPGLSSADTAVDPISHLSPLALAALSGDLEAAVRLAGTRSAEEEVEDEIRDLKARTQREVGR